jgi:hypothetical protein
VYSVASSASSTFSADGRVLLLQLPYSPCPGWRTVPSYLSLAFVVIVPHLSSHQPSSCRESALAQLVASGTTVVRAIHQTQLRPLSSPHCPTPLHIPYPPFLPPPLLCREGALTLLVAADTTMVLAIPLTQLCARPSVQTPTQPVGHSQQHSTPPPPPTPHQSRTGRALWSRLPPRAPPSSSPPTRLNSAPGQPSTA